MGNSIVNLSSDIQNFLFGLVIHINALVPSFCFFANFFDKKNIILSSFILFFSIIIFSFFFTLQIILFYRISALALKEGVYDINSPIILPWSLSNILFLTMERSFVKKIIERFALLRWLYYRLMGARFPYSTIVGRGAIMHDLKFLEIGKKCVLGEFSKIIPHAVEGNKLILKKIKIGNNVTIGFDSKIMLGVEIGDNSIVGTSSLVTKNTKIPSNEIWAGVPARFIKKIKT